MLVVVVAESPSWPARVGVVVVVLVGGEVVVVKWKEGWRCGAERSGGLAESKSSCSAKLLNTASLRYKII